MIRKCLLLSIVLPLTLSFFACGGATPVEEEELAPASRIAFVSDRDGNPEIYVMGTDGSNPQSLIDNPARDYKPSWSP